MKIYHHLEEFLRLPAAAVTIGMFDGVHVGHQRLLQELKAQGEITQCPTVVVTFWPHPVLQLASSPKATLQLLSTFEEKAALLEGQGVDYLLSIPFDAKLAQMSARDFVERVLIDHIGTTHLVVGYDFRFGYQRAGDIPLLREIGAQHGVTVQVMQAASVQDQIVSSTKVRECITQGAIEEAHAYLGLPYVLTCTLSQDAAKHPSAQCLQLIAPDTPKLLPPPGTYGVNVLCESTTYVGRLYIQQRNCALHLEVCLPGFTIPPTAKHVRVELITSSL